ncbi:MAG: ribonuclease III [Oscillospiraceae bacterium]|nr:ribonuclease III [Oscillospiraceae bacterium]
MELLEKTIGYTFRDKALLKNALMHSSYANENRKNGCASNERLEFLGDALLGAEAAKFLYTSFPDMGEGEMTKLRAEMVCEKSLAAVAQRISLGRCLLLGKGEAHGGGRERPSINADAVEALIAAIFLDGGREPAERFIGKYILSVPLTEDRLGVGEGDYKTTLQEKVQRIRGSSVSYEIIAESGPDHNKTFTVAACINGERSGVGEGRTKKEAEQQAAKAALTSLKE